MIPPTERPIHTIGHSNRAIKDFLHLLLESGIEVLADVRTVPKSRTNPQYNKDALSDSLMARGIAYVHFRALGGWRSPSSGPSPNTAWKSPGFKNYADYMMSRSFQTALEELIETALQRRTVIMCAEALPWRCHRMLLSDALTVHGFHVMHIVGERSILEHTLTAWAHVSGTVVTYPLQPE